MIKMDLMSLSMNSIIYVIAESIIIDSVSLYTELSCFFTCLIISHWVADVVNLPECLATSPWLGYFCIPINILRFCFRTQLSLTFQALLSLPAQNL